MNIYFESSPGLIAIMLLSTTAMAPRVAAFTKSLCTLNMARSLMSLSGNVFLGNSLVACISSFQSRECPGMWSSCPNLAAFESSALNQSTLCSKSGDNQLFTWKGVPIRSNGCFWVRFFCVEAKFFLNAGLNAFKSSASEWYVLCALSALGLNESSVLL